MSSRSKLIIIIVIGLLITSFLIPEGIRKWIQYNNDLKEELELSYEEKKKVEDACRSMVVSYNSDKLTYEQYINSESEEKVGWAEQAKIRANKTALSYNEYVLKNKHIWKDNVPDDIQTELEIIS